MFLKLLFLFHVLSLLVIQLSKAQSSAEPHLFDSEEPLEITLKTDFNSLLINRRQEEEQAATILIHNVSDKPLEFNMKISTRGNFRRDTANCDFPPLRLIFDKDKIDGTFFEKNNKVKVVTHCKENIPEFEQFVAREYVAYKIYNLLTPKSFRVRYASITYEDTENNMTSFSKKGFLIEDIDHLADRNGMKESEEKISLSGLDKKNAIRLSLFQYMIGNTDWIVNLSKNLKFITDGTNYYAIPYDFDYTALVNTDYTLDDGKGFLVPPQRKYKGQCYETEELEPVVEEFLDKRRAINKTIRKFDPLDYSSVQHMKNYLFEFFYAIRSEKRIKEEILSDCK